MMKHNNPNVNKSMFERALNKGTLFFAALGLNNQARQINNDYDRVLKLVNESIETSEQLLQDLKPLLSNKS